MVDVAREIACTSSGYHMLTRRAVTLVLAADGLSLREDGRAQQIGRGECRPMMWTGRPGSKPLMPMPALALTTERGEWVVGAADMTVHLDDAGEQESPAPHVWVSGDDLAGMPAPVVFRRRGPCRRSSRPPS